MKLHTLKPAEGSTKSKKRIARGQGSGKGGTSTRGHKGAKSRSGYSKKIGFEEYIKLSEKKQKELDEVSKSLTELKISQSEKDSEINKLRSMQEAAINLKLAEQKTYFETEKVRSEMAFKMQIEQLTDEIRDKDPTLLKEHYVEIMFSKPSIVPALTATASSRDSLLQQGFQVDVACWCRALRVEVDGGWWMGVVDGGMWK